MVNLGEVFDLVNIKFPATELKKGAEHAVADVLADANVTSMILELPIACLTEGKGPVIGGWTTASVPANRTLSATPASGLDGTTQAGDYVQVSRLGAPLVNEVVIGLKDKNRFNASEPKDDGQFADYVTNPTLPALLEILFGDLGVKAPTNFPRTDLIAAFLTGVDGLNKPANVTVSEMLRLNTMIAPTPSDKQSRLGVLGGRLPQRFEQAVVQATMSRHRAPVAMACCARWQSEAALPPMRLPELCITRTGILSLRPS